MPAGKGNLLQMYFNTTYHHRLMAGSCYLFPTGKQPENFQDTDVDIKSRIFFSDDDCNPALKGFVIVKQRLDAKSQRVKSDVKNYSTTEG